MIWEYYCQYVKLIFTKWFWGYTTRFAHPVTVWELVKPKMLMTFSLNIIAFFAYTLVGIILGIIAAYKRNTVIDYVICSITTFFNSLPSFVLIFLMILVLGYGLHWLPPIILPKDADQYYLSFAIPLLALILPQLSSITLLVRGEIIELMDADFYLLAKIKGYNNKQILIKHTLKNALVDIIPLFSHTFMVVMISSFFIEYTANIPGLAKLFLSSIFVGNEGVIYFEIPVVIVICLIYSVMGMVMTLFLDVVYRFIDPQVRIGKTKTEF